MVCPCGCLLYTSHLLAITVMSSSEQTSSNILAALLEQVNAMDANITASVGSHTISVIAQSSYSTVSTDLRDAQTENSQNLLSLQTQICLLYTSPRGRREADAPSPGL